MCCHVLTAGNRWSWGAAREGSNPHRAFNAASSPWKTSIPPRPGKERLNLPSPASSGVAGLSGLLLTAVENI